MNFMRVFTKICIPLTKDGVTVNILKQTTACYSVKMQHRRPLKVFESDGVTEIKNTEEIDKPSRKVGKFSKQDNIKGVIELDKPRGEMSRNMETQSVVNGESDDVTESDIEDENLLGTSYVRLGDRDNTLERMILKVQSKKQREKSNMIMLEGKRLIQDAISAGIIPESIFFTHNSLIENLSMPPGAIKLYKMPYNKMKRWSPLDSPPGIVSFCKIPKQVKVGKKNNTLPLTLICDNVREPGNLGTILRTVAGVGCTSVILTKGCTDLWDSKVLRSAAGGHFHISIKNGLSWEDININMDKDITVFIAHHNDAKGSTLIEKSVPTVPYFSVDYSCLSHIVVIVGGETEGISDDAVQFARYRDGLKINIPLNNNIDSLNVGAAISTILFEIKRQFLITTKNYNKINDKNVI